MVRIVCGWCGVLLKPGPPTAPTSHGICTVCMAALRQEAEGLITRVGEERKLLEPIDPRD